MPGEVNAGRLGSGDRQSSGTPTNPRRRLPAFRTALALALAIPILGGCGVPQEKEANAAQDNEQKSQEFGRSIAQLLPDVVEQSAASVPLDIDLLREQSCLRPERENRRRRQHGSATPAGMSRNLRRRMRCSIRSAYLTPSSA